jgi:hypothetical protein
VAGEWLTFEIYITDGTTFVDEIWTMDGSPVGGFTTFISCPPVAIEASTWGKVKTLYE